MKKITLLNDNFDYTTINQIKVKLPEFQFRAKIIDAVIYITPKENYNKEFTIEYIDEDGNSCWDNVDTVICNKNQLVLNISDEVQDALEKNKTHIILKFHNNSNDSLEFKNESSLTINYLSFNEYYDNSVTNSIDLGNSGNLTINILDGKPYLQTFLTSIKCKTNYLPLLLNYNINSFNFDTGIKNKFNLNVSQFLIKNKTESNLEISSHVEFTDTTTDSSMIGEIKETSILNNYSDDSGLTENLQFTYIDDKSKEQIIEEKYYIFETENDENSTKIYVNKSALSVDLDGNLIYVDEKGKHKVKTELETETNLKLVSSIAEINNSNLVDYEPEELINVKNSIKNIADNLEILENNIENSKLNLCNYALSRYKEYLNIKLNKELIDIEDTEQENNKNKELLTKFYKNEMGLNDVKTFIRESVDTKIYAFLNNAFLEKYYNFNEEDANKKYDSETDLTGDDISAIAWYYKNYIVKSTSINSNSNFTLNTNIPNTISDDEDYNDPTVTFSNNNLANIDCQIKLLYNSILKYREQVKEFENEITKLNHQKELLEMLVPVHYLYNENGTILGFGKTINDNIFRLILVSDLYGNNIYINYDSLDSSRIKSISNNDGNEITFKYNKNNALESLIDCDDNIITFETDSSNLIITHKDKNQSKIICDGDKITNIINSNGLGAKIFYNENNKVSKVQKISSINSVNKYGINYKSGFDIQNDSFDGYLLEDEYIEFVYNNLMSTTVINNKGKQLTYNFDKMGRNIYTYENKFNETSELLQYKVNSYKYTNNKCSKKFTNFPNSENYLSDVGFSNRTSTNSSYFGTFICGVEPYSYSYDNADNNLFEISSTITTKTDEVIMSDNYLAQLNNNINLCSHRTFIVSGWAKANSSFIVNDEDKTYPSYVTNRKFRIKVVVQYQNESDEFSTNFDWRNTDWQYDSVEVVLRNENIVSIKCYIDYSNNSGNIKYTDLQFKQGDFECIEYDDLNRPIRAYSGHSDWQVEYLYTDNSSNISKTIISKKENSSQKYESTYEYSKDNKLIRSVDYNGIVNENIYNSNGFKIKSITYHKDEPSSKLYNEQLIDENGLTVGAVNSLGNQISKYEYDKNSNNIIAEIDNQNQIMSYGFNNNDELLEISKTVDNISNTNTFKFDYGFVSSLKHNDFEVDYDYDDHGRVTKISIAGQTYLTASYSGNDEFVESNGEVFHYVKDDDGNLLQTYYKKSSDSSETLICQNVYDSESNLTYTKDYITGNEYKYIINNFGQTEKVESLQNSKSVIITNSYNEEHNDIKSTTINIGEDSFNYQYNYSNDLNKTLNSITLPSGSSQMFEYDKLNRINKITISNIGSCYDYLKFGDHATNLISKVNYFKNGSTYENLRYKYDEHGNIIEIRKNNQLVSRYKYDSLSRIVREDNKEFGITTTYSYDAGGNIEQKTRYTFTLSNNLDFESGNIIKYCYNSSGWKDQLTSYSGESIVYDSIGNPVNYRGNILEWSHGRQLDKFDNIKFTYNVNGIRTSKTVDSVTTQYYLSGTKILRQTDIKGTELTFIYGADGIIGFKYNNIYYYYKKNILGDIISIIDSNGTEIAKYSYDAWGKHKCLILTNSGNYEEFNINNVYTSDEELYNEIVSINPFRYRSYYFDTETGLYYLNSRYYDPETGRFINADAIEYLDKNTLNGLNLYAYCVNNPIMHIDNSGNAWWHWLIGGLALVAAIVVTVATGGAAAGTVAAVVHGIASSALVSGVIGGTIGAVSGGITYSPTEGIGWNWQGAAQGFAMGTLVGMVSGGMSASLSGVGAQTLMNVATKSTYISKQIALNTALNGALSSLQELSSGDFSLTNVLVASVFGNIGGFLSTKISSLKNNILVTFGLQLGEEIIDFIIEYIKKY